jgi:hypothetical protein
VYNVIFFIESGEEGFRCPAYDAFKKTFCKIAVNKSTNNEAVTRGGAWFRSIVCDPFLAFASWSGFFRRVGKVKRCDGICFLVLP